MKTAALVAAAAVCLGTTSAWSDAYPTKPIRLIAPLPPGGGTDMLGRTIAAPLSEAFGQTVVVDNRPGAGGAFGAEITARTEPDGYTFILVSASYAATGAYRKLAFDPVRDIQSVILIGTTGLALTVNPSVPAKTTGELIKLAKSSPGQLNYASVGPGSAVHLSFELFKLSTDTNIIHVPYKSAGPALNALIAGEVQTSMTNGANHPACSSRLSADTRHHTREAVTGLALCAYDQRNRSGLRSQPLVWHLGPKRVRRDIVIRWNKEVAKVLLTAEMKERTRGEGLDLAGGAPERFGERIKADIEKWRRVMKESHVEQEG